MTTPASAPAPTPAPAPAPAPRQLVTLTRDMILGKPPKLEVVRVPVPELGHPDGVVFVRALTGRERDDWEVLIFEIAERENERVKAGAKPDAYYLTRNRMARLASRTVCDEAGLLVFRPGDEAMLTTYPAAALCRIYEVARRLSLLEEQDVQELVGKAAAGVSSDAGTA